MSILISQNSGYCFGVKNAVDKSIELSKNHNNIFSIGELVHNDYTLNILKNKGINVIEENEIDDIISKYDKPYFIIRAHGVDVSIKKKLEKLKNDNRIDFCDLTCPFVEKIHSFLDKSTSDNTFTIYLGNHNHPETIGNISYVKGCYTIVNDYGDYLTKVNDIVFDNLIFVSQTTAKYNDFVKIKNHILTQNANAIIFDSVCKTTINRQTEIEEFSKECDFLYIFGDLKSSNSMKLFNLAKKYCNNTLFVSSLEDVKVIPNHKKYAIGIASGASTPREMLSEFEKILKNVKF